MNPIIEHIVSEVKIKGYSWTNLSMNSTSLYKEKMGGDSIILTVETHGDYIEVIPGISTNHNRSRSKCRRFCLPDPDSIKKAIKYIKKLHLDRSETIPVFAKSC